MSSEDSDITSISRKFYFDSLGYRLCMPCVSPCDAYHSTMEKLKALRAGLRVKDTYVSCIIYKQVIKLLIFIFFFVPAVAADLPYILKFYFVRYYLISC